MRWVKKYSEYINESFSKDKKDLSFVQKGDNISVYFSNMNNKPNYTVVASSDSYYDENIGKSVFVFTFQGVENNVAVFNGEFWESE